MAAHPSNMDQVVAGENTILGLAYHAVTSLSAAINCNAGHSRIYNVSIADGAVAVPVTHSRVISYIARTYSFTYKKKFGQYPTVAT